MNLKRNYHQLQEAIKEYRLRLQSYSEEKFSQKPSPGEWSLAQVYAHILTANLLTLRAMQKCIAGTAVETNEKIAWKARWILWLGRFPKGRKVPPAVEERTPIYDKQKSYESIEEFLEKIEELYASHSHWSRTQKIKHPALGLLNCYEWIRFMQIHSIHHLNQLDRIEKKIM